MALSCAQICKLAAQKAHGAGYLVQAGVFLNSELSNLARNYDFDVLRKTHTISITPQSDPRYPFLMPSDYLRTSEVFYNISGTVFVPDSVPLHRFDALFTGSGIANYPEKFTTNLNASPVEMYFWPPSSIPIAATHRYYSLPDDIVSPETSSSVPWFPDAMFLVDAVAADIMGITDDTREDKTRATAIARLDKFLQLAKDDEGYAQQVALDPSNFRPRTSAKPTKTTGF